jgi:putative Holliday junction resolvase
MPVVESAFELPRGRLLALDLGQARHGVAVCDVTGTLATPLVVLPRRRTRAEDFAELESWVLKERVAGVIVGLPVQGPDGVGKQERWTLRYGRRLAGALSVPVAFWDESLSTVDASSAVSRRDRDRSDAVAAALILQDFLEARRARIGQVSA